MLGVSPRRTNPATMKMVTRNADSGANRSRRRMPAPFEELLTLPQVGPRCRLDPGNLSAERCKSGSGSGNADWLAPAGPCPASFGRDRVTSDPPLGEAWKATCG